jgi:dihydroorotase
MPSLLLKNARVIDPANGLDDVTDIRIENGHIAVVGKSLTETVGTEIRDLDGLIAAPGLIDLHTHIYWGGTSLGVDPADLARKSGTTTLIDAGSAGAGTFPGFRRHIIERTDLRILAFLNLSYAGIFAFSASVQVGECTDLRLLDQRECLRLANEHPDLIVGIKARIGRIAGGGNGVAPLDMALEVAEAAGLPVMVHLDQPPPSSAEVVSRLRRGDILTHCYRPFPNAPVTPDNLVRSEILAARDRGVIFDIGHGGAAFGFNTARAMLDAGFLPDVISSDAHVLSVRGPAFNLLHTMSKFLSLGMDLKEVIRRTTVGPAAAVRQPSLGSLTVGQAADVTILKAIRGRFEYRDSLGEQIVGEHALELHGIVNGGRWWHPVDH